MDVYFVHKYIPITPVAGVVTPVAGVVPSLWVYADAPGSMMNVQGRMSQWTDQTGNMNHFTQTDVSRMPVLIALGINGRPSLQIFAKNKEVRAANSNIDIQT